MSLVHNDLLMRIFGEFASQVYEHDGCASGRQTTPLYMTAGLVLATID